MRKGSRHTEESKRLIAESRIGRGIKHTKESIEKIRAKMKGRPLSEAHRKVVGCKKGVAKSPEHRAKISAANKAYAANKKGEDNDI